MGDFNINLLDLDRKTNVSNFQNLLSSHMFSLFILQPTRVAEKSATLINNIFVNSLKSYTHSGNITTKISDHLLQFLVLRIKIKKEHSQKNNIYARNFQFFHLDEFEIIFTTKMILMQLLTHSWKPQLN